MRSFQFLSTTRRPMASAHLTRVAGALALSAALLGGLAATATPAHAAPPRDTRPQCQQVGPIKQCIGPNGVYQQVGDLVQSAGAGASSQVFLGPGSGSSLQVSSGDGAVVVSSSTGGGVVASSSVGGSGNVVVSNSVSGSGSAVASTSAGGCTNAVTATGGGAVVVSASAGGDGPCVSTVGGAAGFTAMPALPSDVPVAIVVARGEGATYKRGETVALAYAVNKALSIRLASVQDGQTTTLLQGSGEGTRGLVTATAGPNLGQQTFKLVGLGDDLSVHEASVTITVVE